MDQRYQSQGLNTEVELIALHQTVVLIPHIPSQYFPRIRGTLTDIFIIITRREAEVHMDGSFLVRLTYEDEITYNIVAAAEKVLGEWATN